MIAREQGKDVPYVKDGKQLTLREALADLAARGDVGRVGWSSSTPTAALCDSCTPLYGYCAVLRKTPIVGFHGDVAEARAEEGTSQGAR